MRKVKNIILCGVCACFAVIASIVGMRLVAAEKVTGPPPPVPPVAQFCGNVLTVKDNFPYWIKEIQRQGCEKAEFAPVGDGWYLVYGVKIVWDAK